MDLLSYNAFNQNLKLRAGRTLMQLVVLLIVLGSSLNANAQTSPNTSKALGMPNLWKSKELLQPEDLAMTLRNPKAKRPVIYNIGVVEDIEGAKNVGAASKKENLDKLTNSLKTLPKNSMVVIYCGCCPFEKCPNIRPAFSLMKKMGFTNGKLLNIPVNLKQDWINKGYPMQSRTQTSL